MNRNRMEFTMNYNYKETIEYLLEWYYLNARILPWRENKNPYYIWISEIMLQQTRVEAVKGYFERFIKELPKIKDLAEVSEERLMKLWEGLGYYNRARNLQKAAILIIQEYEGKLPRDYNALLKLPGIGSYTAGAIASIAFDLPEPAVDGNVLRVMKRIAGSFDDITKNTVKKELESDLRVIMPKKASGDFNQAVMELGAIICIPNGKPLCDRCPVMHLCQAFHQGNEMKIPVKSPKKARKVEEKTVLVMEKDGKFLLHKREKKGLLAGLYELPNIEGKLSILAIEERLQSNGMCFREVIELGEAKHIFSHIEWHMKGYYIRLNDFCESMDEFHEKMNCFGENNFFQNANQIKEKTMSDFYQQNLDTENKTYLWADKEQIDSSLMLPSAFDAYRSILTS